MAVIRPFQAVMPAHAPGEDVTDRTAPPYDVISTDEREELLARDPHNVVALELPEGSLDPSLPGNRYQTGRERWRAWRAQGILATDPEEAVYVMEQRFTLEGRSIRRRCFVAAVDLEPFDAGVVLPHERTLPRTLDDRMNLIRHTAANLSPVFAMFSDPAFRTDSLFEEAMASEPLMRATDDEGVESVVWALRDPDRVAALAGLLDGNRVFIADGHHRYTTALSYRDERRSAERATCWRSYDAVMMALVNMDDPDLVVLPAHRITRGSAGFDPIRFRQSLARYFDLLDPREEPLAALASARRQAFIVRTPADNTTVLADLREDVDPVEAIPGSHSADWKRLDVAILQELILGPLLDIHPDRPETLERLEFVKDAGQALLVDDHDAIFLVRPTGIGQLRAVALAGEMMPQKSTYFYPKLLSGLLMRSLE